MPLIQVKQKKYKEKGTTFTQSEIIKVNTQPSIVK